MDKKSAIKTYIKPFLLAKCSIPSYTPIVGFRLCPGPT